MFGEASNATIWTMLSGVTALVILSLMVYNYVPSMIKRFITPKIDVKISYIRSGENEQLYGKEIPIHPKDTPELSIQMRSKWEYTIDIFEVHGNGQSKVNLVEHYAKDRPWLRGKYYTDIHGDFKVTPDITIKNDEITSPTIIEISIGPPLNSKEERKITVKIRTKQSNKLLKKNFKLKAVIP